MATTNQLTRQPCYNQIMMNPASFIVQDQSTMVGKPRIRGTRITVEHILELYAGGWAMEDVLQAHPDLSEAEILAALEHAQQVYHAFVSSYETSARRELSP